MWTTIALNFHQLTDSKVQLNINKVNDYESNNINNWQVLPEKTQGDWKASGFLPVNAHAWENI